MIIRFSVENFHSFRESQTLHLAAVPSCKERLEENTFLGWGDRLRLLRSVALYGANASGKTNFFLAVRCFHQLVTLPQVLDTLPADVFLFAGATRERPVTFEIEWVQEETCYRYGFSMTREKFVREWLYAKPLQTRRERALFLRDHHTEEDVIEVRSAFEGADEAIIRKTRSQALFLSTCGQFAVPEAEKILAFFKTQLLTVIWSADLSFGAEFTLNCLKEGRNADQIKQFVRQTDPCIADLWVEEEASTAPVAQGFAPEKRKRLWFSAQGSDQRYLVEQFSSLGTFKALQLAGPIFESLSRGSALFVDELDARLHPILTQAILRLFNSSESNPHNAQLIFNTHDTNLLNTALYDAQGKKHFLLRRDQVYFMERDATFSSHLYSLIEFGKQQKKSIRKNEAFERDYLEGLYGAIPFLGDLQKGGATR